MTIQMMFHVQLNNEEYCVPRVFMISEMLKNSTHTFIVRWLVPDTYIFDCATVMLSVTWGVIFLSTVLLKRKDKGK